MSEVRKEIECVSPLAYSFLGIQRIIFKANQLASSVRKFRYQFHKIRDRVGKLARRLKGDRFRCIGCMAVRAA